MEATCKRCGKKFELSRDQKKRGRGVYCSNECTFTGPVHRACDRCGKSFTCKPSEDKRCVRRFCSRKCSYPERVELTCKQCGKKWSVPPSQTDDKSFCSKLCYDRSRLTGYRCKDGYVKIQGCHPTLVEYFQRFPHADRNKSRLHAEHNIVMALAIGRPLLKGETVHHINGQRDDNRIENLELWSKNHGKGQRVQDLLAYYKFMVPIYEDALAKLNAAPVEPHVFEEL